MGYVAKTLADGEFIVESAKFNWTYHIELWLWFYVSSILTIVICYLDIATGLTRPNAVITGWVCAISSLVLTIGWAIVHSIVLLTTEIVITNFRFVYKTGLIARNTKEVSLNKIEEITLNQSAWGRLFCYGRLTLRGTGVGRIELPDLDDPIRLRRSIETAKANLRSSLKHQE